MQKIGLKRDLRCINPCKSGDGSYLKKIDLPTQGGGVEVGILGGQKIKSPGNVMNCPENQSICFYPTHPGGGSRGGGGWGSKFKKSGKFHELSRKSITNLPPPGPPPPKGVAVGILGGQKIKSPGNVMNCPENQYNLFLPIPPWGGSRGGGGWGSKFQKFGKFHELLRKSITIFLPPPPKGVAVGILGGQKIKSPGNVMNCREK